MELFGVFSIACNLCFQFIQVAASFPQTLFLIFRVSAENHAVCQAKFCNVLKTSVMFPSFRLESAGTANCPQALFSIFPPHPRRAARFLFSCFSAPLSRAVAKSPDAPAKTGGPPAGKPCVLGAVLMMGGGNEVSAEKMLFQRDFP